VVVEPEQADRAVASTSVIIRNTPAALFKAGIILQCSVVLINTESNFNMPDVFTCREGTFAIIAQGMYNPYYCRQLITGERKS